jgi:PERQ amino acid-rich with GYF domain-containing protein
MRSKPTRTGSSDTVRPSQGWGRDALVQGAASAEDVSSSNGHSQVEYNKITRSYTLDELLQVWATLQQRLQTEGLEDQYHSLAPIRDLVSQVQQDLSFQQKKSNSPKVAELKARLGEFDQWAQREQNGLDFGSILSSIKSTSAPNPQSPFISRNIPLQRESSFSALNSPIGNVPSQGLPFMSPPLELLQPSEIQWFYIDPSGMHQGPFDGPQMQGWYSGGYLNMDLQLKHEESPDFFSLAEFVSYVGNSQTPFLVPLQKSKPVLSNNGFSNLSFDSNSLFASQGFLQQTAPQLPQIHSTQQSNIFGANSGRSSPWAPQSALATPADNGVQDFGLTAQSSFLSNFNESTSITATAGNSFVNPHEDDLFTQIHTQVLNNVLTEDNIPASASSTTEHVQIQSDQEFQAEVTHSPKQEIKSSPVPTSTAKRETVKKQVKPKVVIDSKPELRPTPRPVLAPWANKPAPQSSGPRLTLDQIQQIEAEENAKQMKLKAEKDKQLAAQLLANTEKSLREAEALKSALPSTASWANTNKTATPTKTLLDIQREEAAAASKALNPTGMKQTPAKTSFASIATSSNAWTTVTSKKVTQQKSHPPTTTNSVKQVTPDVLRSVSAQAPIAAPTQGKSVSPRQEFLTWCRSTLKLNNGVKIDDILEIMLMLPVGQESSEIIADTIYCNSSVMDGRRFAQEFTKRRRAVESQANDGLTWTDALHISAMDDDDGWDFQVVKKKNKRRS